MKKNTLKELIEIEFDRCETISHFKQEVFRLIDLYNDDNFEKSSFISLPAGLERKVIPPPPEPPKSLIIKEGADPQKPKNYKP
jgi:hypothetical protein